MNLIIKLLITSSIIYIADLLSPQINFSQFWQAVIVGVVYGLTSFLGDILLLGRLSNITLTWINVIVSTTLIWSFSLFFTASHITFSGSLFTGILLGFTEYLIHRSILANRRREII